MRAFSPPMSLALLVGLLVLLLFPAMVVDAFPSMLRRRFQAKSILGEVADLGNAVDATVQPQVSTTGSTNNLQWVPDAAVWNCVTECSLSA